MQTLRDDDPGRSTLRVFVTGASGFIGKPLVTALVARGDRVVALTRGSERTDPGVEWVTGDPSAPGSWQQRCCIPSRT